MLGLSIAGQVNSASTQGWIVQEWPDGFQISRRRKTRLGNFLSLKNNLISTYNEHKAKTIDTVEVVFTPSNQCQNIDRIFQIMVTSSVVK